jgi:hypothetical protein
MASGLPKRGVASVICSSPQLRDAYRMEFLNKLRSLPVVLLCVVLSGCIGKTGPPVQIIVPKNLSGLIRIVEDKSGMIVPFEKGEFVYRIPTNGVLVVVEAEGFAEFHKERASFSDGVPLQLRSTDSADGLPGEVAIYSLGRTSRELAFFVGTRQEMIAFLKSGGWRP